MFPSVAVSGPLPSILVERRPETSDFYFPPSPASSHRSSVGRSNSDCCMEAHPSSISCNISDSRSTRLPSISSLLAECPSKNIHSYGSPGSADRGPLQEPTPRQSPTMHNVSPELHHQQSQHHQQEWRKRFGSSSFAIPRATEYSQDRPSVLSPTSPIFPASMYGIPMPASPRYQGQPHLNRPGGRHSHQLSISGHSSNAYHAPHSIATASVALDRYVCDECSKSFSRPSSLRIHQHSHTGERPFVCSVQGCERAFSVRSNMRRHMKVHNL